MAGDGIIANGVTEILKRLSILVANEISLAWGVKDELLKLKKTLDMILDVMIDAEKKQLKSGAVRRWLEELKDIAYEAEDILDEYAYEVICQRGMTRKRDRVSNFFSLSNPIKFRQQIAHEIKVINKKLNKHAMHKEILGLQMLELGRSAGPMDLDESSKLRELRETDSIVDQSLGIIGRDRDKSKIINMLLLHNDPYNQDGNIQVIPIVGMGGVGKTTLVQLIYNDKTVKNHFDLTLWVCVSDDFNVKKLFAKIIESITGNKCEDVSNIDVIARQLQQRLSEKKYLLVLDDVWNKKEEEWVKLKKPLLMGGSGSKILVTTRSEEVASIMGDELHSYKLGVLDEDQSWSLFHERTFGYLGGAVETPTLMAIGKELVKKCGGLPLALIFLISLLRNKDEHEWSVINENKIWVQSYDEDETRILPILKLSYDHLPSHLKQCFSYFSLFGKDFPFDRKTMILLWMAEGFLPQPPGGNNISMKEVGNKYFNSLLRNSFFQDVEKNVLGQVSSFKMHDLVHDLAIHVAGDREYLILYADQDMESIPSVRRLQLTNYDEGINLNKIMAASHNKAKLRTLIISDTCIKKIENNAFNGMKRLRVLHLSDTPEMEEISSSSMSNLKHLRYLDLSSTKITNLPKSVMTLYHLQTLDLIRCENLKELPKGISKLINLRHLHLPKHITIPREIGQLSTLRTLYPCNVINYDNKGIRNTGPGGRGGCGIEILEGLNLLNEDITINHLRNVRSGIDAQRANLKGKKNLNQIYLNWHTDPVDDDDAAAREDDYSCGYNIDEAVLEALQPHPNLKLLVINQYFGAELPRWMGDPFCLPNLTNLQLGHCTKCEQLVEFGKLQSLKVLRLFNMDGIKCLGNEFYGNSSSTGEVVLFPSLKQLVLSDMGSLEEWVDIPPPTPTITYSCFPYLEKIYIRGCPNLRITPTHFPSLKELYLKEINERVAVPLITTSLDSLESVQLEKISELRFLPHSLLQGSNLEELKVIDCLDFQGFHPNEDDKEDEETEEAEEAEEEEALFSIIVLWLVNLPGLKFLPDIRSLFSLEYLRIKDCESFKPLPEDLTCLSSSLEHLISVEIENVKGVEDFKWEK